VLYRQFFVKYDKFTQEPGQTSTIEQLVVKEALHTMDLGHTDDEDDALAGEILATRDVINGLAYETEPILRSDYFWCGPTHWDKTSLPCSHTVGLFSHQTGPDGTQWKMIALQQRSYYP